MKNKENMINNDKLTEWLNLFSKLILSNKFLNYLDLVIIKLSPFIFTISYEYDITFKFCGIKCFRISVHQLIRKMWSIIKLTKMNIASYWQVKEWCRMSAYEQRLIIYRISAKLS